ncbi:hypothetical protein [Novipirellula herctigrandis]
MMILSMIFGGAPHALPTFDSVLAKVDVLAVADEATNPSRQ